MTMSGEVPAVQVVAVMGACGPERKDFAAALAQRRGAVLLQADRLATDETALDSALRLLRLVPDRPELVVEYPLASAITEVIGSLTASDGLSGLDRDHRPQPQLTEVICVVDAAHLLDDLASDDYVVLEADQHGRHPGELAYVCRAEVIVKQIEYASTVMMVNWRLIDPGELAILVALVAHLSPHAQVRFSGDPGARTLRSKVPGYSGEESRAGWTCLLNGDFQPRHRHARVSAFRYEQLRPFHPGRLKQLLDLRVEVEEFGRVIRSAGFARLATRGHITAQWEHIGQIISLAPLAFDHQLEDPEEMLAFGQDIAFIGMDLDAEGLTAALDEATLTDVELTDGPQLWRTFSDPFPVWESVTEAED
ncbi:GTP-binding protein [Nesterenkonia sp. DZ6]|uniref:GTP-binding protein n=1 Tax=Nesterenkonia sp. DZ6 TaxID=2901229 RepID=UPI001F4CB169|nr:GTP-binding protein [Nesterenkonia sp. DZ6]MCH8561488.1 GTP-binding protein [Nesterenkonia sp. DZ6]